jgi:hypothetical protein
MYNKEEGGHKTAHVMPVASKWACMEIIELYKARRMYKRTPRQRPA